MKKLMNSKKFEDYKHNEISAAWAVLGGDDCTKWNETKMTNSYGCTVCDVACECSKHDNRYDKEDVKYVECK